MVKLYKITLFVIDLSGDFKNPEEIIESLDCNKYVSIFQSKGKSIEIGEWDDDHILNDKRTPIKEFEKYFNEGD